MFVGSVAALLNGVIQPVGSIITGTIVNVLLGDDPPETLMHRAAPAIKAYIAAGIAVLIVAFIQASSFTH